MHDFAARAFILFLKLLYSIKLVIKIVNFVVVEQRKENAKYRIF